MFGKVLIAVSVIISMLRHPSFILLSLVHWSLVNAESPWPERQGHAAVYFKGSILVLGGFDATGYSNAVYGLLLDDATSIGMD
jgi:hypothetical protein